MQVVMLLINVTHTIIGKLAHFTWKKDVICSCLMSLSSLSSEVQGIA